MLIYRRDPHRSITSSLLMMGTSFSLHSSSCSRIADCLLPSSRWRMVVCDLYMDKERRRLFGVEVGFRTTRFISSCLTYNFTFHSCMSFSYRSCARNSSYCVSLILRSNSDIFLSFNITELIRWFNSNDFFLVCVLISINTLSPSSIHQWCGCCPTS